MNSLLLSVFFLGSSSITILLHIETPFGCFNLCFHSFLKSLFFAETKVKRNAYTKYVVCSATMASKHTQNTMGFKVKLLISYFEMWVLSSARVHNNKCKGVDYHCRHTSFTLINCKGILFSSSSSAVCVRSARCCSLRI